MDKIICVGKNYLEHARELGDQVPEKPVLFLKPPSALVAATKSGETLEVPLPRDRGSVHHETEIVLKLSTGGRIQAVTLGLDMTLREVQTKLKKNGHPWEISKVFSGSAIVGPWIAAQDFAPFLDSPFELTIGGRSRQVGRGQDMTLKPEVCITYAAEYFTLCDGDLLFTGTPAGVGPVQVGDVATLSWRGSELFSVRWV